MLRFWYWRYFIFLEVKQLEYPVKYPEFQSFERKEKYFGEKIILLFQRCKDDFCYLWIELIMR